MKSSKNTKNDYQSLLTRAEELCMENKIGEPYTYEEIAEFIGVDEEDIYAIRKFINKLRPMLQARSRTLVTARGVGYVLGGADACLHQGERKMKTSRSNAEGAKRIANGINKQELKPAMRNVVKDLEKVSGHTVYFTTKHIDYYSRVKKQYGK